MKTRLRASPVVVADGLLLLVRLRDPVSGVVAHYPPGGGVETGETPDVTAAREALEETGVRIVVDPASELVARYPFVWAGTDVDVTTHFYAARLAPGQGRVLFPVVDADYNLGAEWRPIAEALELLAVHPPIAEATKRILERMSKSDGQLRSTGKGAKTMKFMLMMNAPRGTGDYQITTWAPERLRAHISYMKKLNVELTAAGELAAAEGLGPPEQARIVRANAAGEPEVTDGPFPEAKEFLAGYWIVDVENAERAYAIAARASTAPGPAGEPLNLAIEVRRVMGIPPIDL